MLRVALTGGIATGKTYVLDRFRSLGIPCLDADQLVHGVEVAGTEATAAIAARFGADVLGDDGSVNRAKLGAIVFADPAARRDLEAIVHPAVFRAIEAGIRGFERSATYPFAVVDVPLLYETGAERRYDKVIVTACPPETQIARLLSSPYAEVRKLGELLKEAACAPAFNVNAESVQGLIAEIKKELMKEKEKK